MSALDLHVHRWDPATADGALTLLLLHGTGGDENDLVPLARMVAPTAAVLSVRGNVLEQGMPRFFRRLREGVFDLEDLQRRTADLGDFLIAAARRYEFEFRDLAWRFLFEKYIVTGGNSNAQNGPLRGS